MSSSKIKVFPSILAEKRELLRVEALLIFISTSGGMEIDFITSREASMDERSSEIFGVKVYLGGIIIATYYQILPNVTRYLRGIITCFSKIMKLIDKKLSSSAIRDIKKEFGSYIKLTIDLDNEWVIAGCELHADGERMLLNKGSSQNTIWGGGIDLTDKIIDTTAVLNLRPKLGNDSMEILDLKRREKFVKMVRKYFKVLWR